MAPLSFVIQSRRWIVLVAGLALAGCPTNPSPAPNVQTALDRVDDDPPPTTTSPSVPCSAATPGVGGTCGKCGVNVCDAGKVVCDDPGLNICGTCDQLSKAVDTSVGTVGDSCGEHGCGIVACNADQSATVCIDDHPRNVCGGCDKLSPSTGSPGDKCSTCGSGELMCMLDGESFACFGGREPTNFCGSCDRCILKHAVMEDQYDVGFVRPGTIAVIESIDDSATGLRLTFDPLILGPGGCCIPQGTVYLSASPTSLTATRLRLSPAFSRPAADIFADPLRSYVLTKSDLSQYRYVVIADANSEFDSSIFVVGELRDGPPPAPNLE